MTIWLNVDDYDKAFITKDMEQLPNLDLLLNEKFRPYLCSICQQKFKIGDIYFLGFDSSGIPALSCTGCYSCNSLVVYKTQYRPDFYPYETEFVDGWDLLNQFSLPYNSPILWRYMDFDKFLAILESRSIYIPKASEFEDPLEGEISLDIKKDVHREFFGKDGFESYDALARRIQANKDDSRVLCWYSDKVESMALWNMYCQKKESGIAITMDFNSLYGKTFDKPGIALGEVRYLNYLIRFPNRFFPLFNKWDIYSYEKEVRLIATNNGAGSKYEEVPICPSDIEDIFISPYAPNWFHALVRRVLKRYCFDNVQIATPFYQI
jgi:hypothetical protein